MSKDDIEILIDPEFEHLLPAQTAEEIEQLEKNIIDCGLLCPLVVWVQVTESGDTFTLIDGHTRYSICKRRKVSYDVVELSFNKRSEVLEWIYENQRGRRNLPAEWEGYIRGKVYNEKKRQKNGPRQNTAEVVAADNDVTSRTVQRDGRYAVGVDRVAEKAPELKTAILEGKAKVRKKDLEALATASDADVDAVVKDIKSGARKPKIAPTIEVAFEKVESHAGSIARLVDEINSMRPSGKYSTLINDSLSDILSDLNEWRESSEPEFQLAIPTLQNGVFA